MAQNPLATTIAVTPTGVQVPLKATSGKVLANVLDSTLAPAVQTLDVKGNLPVVSSDATSSTLNITAATVVKATAGRLVRISVTTAGAAGTANDCVTTGAAAAGNLIAVIPAAVGVISLNWPCALGIVIVPGDAQVISVSYA